MLSTALVVGLIGAGFAQQATDSVRNGHHKNHKNHKETASKQVKTPEERARLFTASLDKRLNLSESQEKEIYNIQLENAKKVDAMRKQHHSGEKQKQSAHKAHDTGLDKIQSILTDEQRVTYQKLIEERRKKMMEHKSQHQHHMNSSGKDSIQSQKLKQKKIK